MKGEYKETFFHDGRRFVMDARWVWMRQKQVLFRRAKPAAIFDELGLPPGRRVLVWGADRDAREFVAAARARTAEVVVIASATREKRGIAELSRMGVPPTHILDRDGFSFPEEMPDPLTPEGRLNPEYASGFTRPAQALGKALWKVFGPRVSPDVVVDRVDQDTLHFSTFVARDFDERDVFPCGAVVLRGKSDLSIRGSHMYGASQAADVIRLLSAGKIAMDQEDLEITDLPGLPGLQQRMLDGTMRKPKGVALVQADRPGRTVADYEESFRGEIVQAADPAARKFVDVRMAGDVAVVTLTRPDSLNALSEELLSQFAAVVREAGSLGTIGGRTVKAIVLTGAGRAFVAGADVKEFHGKTADVVDALAWKNISVFTELETPGPPRRGAGGRLRAGGRQRTRDERALPDRDRERRPRAARGETGDHPGIRRHAAPPPPDRPRGGREVCVNGEPVDGSTAVALGWADEFVPSSVLPSARGRRRTRIRWRRTSRASPGLGRPGRRGEGRTRAALRASGSEGDPRSPDPRKGDRGKFARGAACGGAGRPAGDEARVRARVRGGVAQRREDVRRRRRLARRPGVGRPFPREGRRPIVVPDAPPAGRTGRRESGRRSRRRRPETVPSPSSRSARSPRSSRKR